MPSSVAEKPIPAMAEESMTSKDRTRSLPSPDTVTLEMTGACVSRMTL